MLKLFNANIVIECSVLAESREDAHSRFGDIDKFKDELMRDYEGTSFTTNIGIAQSLNQSDEAKRAAINWQECQPLIAK